MLRVPRDPEAVRALSTYEAPDGLDLAVLADPTTLTAYRTMVTEQNLRRTQRLAATIFEQGRDGISWWSYYHPTITLVETWISEGLQCLSTEGIGMSSDAVTTAAELIVRPIRPSKPPRAPVRRRVLVPAESVASPLLRVAVAAHHRGAASHLPLSGTARRTRRGPDLPHLQVGRSGARVRGLRHPPR